MTVLEYFQLPVRLMNYVKCLGCGNTMDADKPAVCECGSKKFIHCTDYGRDTIPKDQCPIATKPNRSTFTIGDKEVATFGAVFTDHPRQINTGGW